MKKPSKSRMRQRLSSNTSMLESESEVKGSLFYRREGPPITSLVEMPLHFFANHLLDVLFIQFFHGVGVVGMPIALVGTHSPFLQD